MEMKLIPSETEKAASENYAAMGGFFDDKIMGDNAQTDFIAGIRFAEIELKNLAIEFKKWPYYYKFDSPEENFERFITQKQLNN